MAANLPMMIALQLDTTSAQRVAKQIESSLGNIQVKTLDAKNFAKTNAAIGETSKRLEEGQKKAETFWNTLEGKTRSAIAYTVISTALLKVTGAVSQATREAIKYEAELLKISQVTGDSVAKTRYLEKSLFDISKQYNVNITKVAQLTRTLTQTGLSFREAAKGAEVLARTSLLATFDSLTSTTEGLIAVMQTFNLTVDQSGKVLEKINAVSKAFAVESSDIVEAIRRTGGAFGSAGGQIEELIALFTSVRSTSRESAETIATGFRTIFGRLQRPRTIQYFKDLGAQLETVDGQFVGPLEAIKEIARALEARGIKAGSTQFAEVVEQIGGIRQISRVVPLLEQYMKTEKALEIQNKASAESYNDIEKAQKGLGFQLGQLKQEFTELITEIVNSPSFKVLAQTFIGITRTVISLTKSLKPLLPLITAFATIKIGRSITKLATGGINFKGVKDSLGFATGGMVPGSGNSDTVPAMLTPGEFVIRKSAVKAFGADRLASINKYAKGGPVSLSDLQKRQGKTTITESLNDVREPIDNISANLNRKQIKFGDQSSGIDWNKFVYDVDAIYKKQKVQGGQPFSAQGKAFETVIQKIAGGALAPESSYPVDIVNNGEPIEVKFTKELTDAKDLVSKLYRYKYKTNQLDNLNFNKGYDEDVDVGNLTVYEMGQGEKEKFNKWYGAKVRKGLSPQKFAEGGVAEDIQLSQEALQDLQRYTLSLSFGLNSQLADPSNERYATRNYEREIKNLDSLMVFDLPSMLYSGYSHKKYEIIKKKIDSLSPDPRNPDFNLLKGEVLSFPGFLSASTDYDLAKSFGSDMSGGVMNIKTKGKGVDVVQALTSAGLTTSLSETEKEFILPRNSKFKVENIERNPKGLLSYFLDVQQFANGGKPKGAGTDTVPALLTPGEFVINKKSAEAFGYDKLHKINKYAAGGFVGMGGTMGAQAQKTIMAQNPFASMSGAMGEAARKTVMAANNMSEAMTETANVIEKQGEKTKQGLVEATDGIKNASSGFKTSILEMVFYAEAAANTLEQFGFVINREGLEQGKQKSLKFGLAAEVVRKIDVENINKFSSKLKTASEGLDQFGKKIGGKAGGVISKMSGYLGQFAKGLIKWGPKIAKGAKLLARALDIVAWTELIGGFADALFSIDYAKIKKRAIEEGDVERAGSAAVDEYNQQFLRSIPVIGGFLAAIQELLPDAMMLPDAMGRLVKATAELEASMVRLDKQTKLNNESLDLALKEGNPEEIREAMKKQQDTVNEFRQRVEEQGRKIEEAKQGRAGYIATRTAMGAAGGAIAGGGIGLMVGTMVGGPLGIAIGVIATVLGMLIGAITSFMQAFQDSHDRIIEGYQAQGRAWEKWGLEEKARLEKNAQSMQAYALQVMKAGGSIDAAMAAVRERFTDEAFEDIYGKGVQSSEDLAKSYEEQKNRAKELQNQIERAREKEKELADKWDKGWSTAWWNFYQGSKDGTEQLQARTAADRAQLEAELAVAEARRNATLELQMALNHQEAMNKQIEIENAAMRERIKLSRELTEIFDDLNAASLGMKDALDQVNAASNGGLSRQAALDRAELGISATTLDMEAEQVLRDDAAFNEMFTAISRLGSNAANDMMRQTRASLDIVKVLETEIEGGLFGEEIARIRQEAADAAAESMQGTGATDPKLAGTLIAEKIEAMLRDKGAIEGELEPRLKKAIQDYGNNIAEGMDAAEAGEKLKQELGEEAVKLIEDTQEKYNEYIQMEKELYSLRIEEVRRNAELAQKAYDAEKEYFEQRIALTEKVDDFLNPEPLGAGKAAFLKQRSMQRRENRFAGLRATRRRGGLPGDTSGRERAFNGTMRNFDSSADDAALTLEKLAAEGNMLLSTLQDEISIEQEHLDNLIEMAKAEQEYIQALNNAQGALVRDLVTGTDEEQADLLSNLNAAAFSAMQGSFQGIPADMKKDIFSIFDQFGDVEIPGLGMTGRDAQRNIAKNELMMNYGLDEATAEQLASKAVNDRVPIDERMKKMIELQEQKILALLERERQLKESLQLIDKANNDQFSKAVNKFEESIDKFVAGLKKAEPEEAPLPAGGKPGEAPLPAGGEPGEAPLPAGGEPGEAPLPAGGEPGAQDRPKDPMAGAERQKRGEQQQTDNEEQRFAGLPKAQINCECICKCIEKAIANQTQALASQNQNAESSDGGILSNVADELAGLSNATKAGITAGGDDSGTGGGLSNASKAATTAIGGLVGKFGPKIFKSVKDGLPGLTSTVGKAISGAIEDFGLGFRNSKVANAAPGALADDIDDFTRFTINQTRSGRMGALVGGMRDRAMNAGNAIRNSGFVENLRSGYLGLTQNPNIAKNPLIDQSVKGNRYFQAANNLRRGLAGQQSGWGINEAGKYVRQFSRTHQFGKQIAPSVNRVKPVVDAVGGGLKNAAGYAGGGLKNAAGYVGGGLKNAAGYVGDKLGSLGSLISKIPGAGMVSNLIQGGKNATGYVGGTLGSLGGLVGKGIGKAMPMLGPALGGAFGYFAPTEQSADPDNPYADALSNRSAGANAIFGALGGGATTMGDVGAQSSLGWALGVDQGSFADKSLGNLSQYAMGSLQNLYMGNVAAPITTGATMFAQEFAALNTDKTNLATAEAKTGQMGQSFVDANAIDNTALAGMTPEEVIKVKEAARLRGEVAKYQEKVDAGQGGAKSKKQYVSKYDENGLPVEYSDTNVDATLTNEEVLNKLKTQLNNAEAEIAKLKAGKEAADNEQKIAEEGGRDSESYKQNYQAAMEANATEEQKQAQEEKVANQKQAFEDAGQEFKTGEDGKAMQEAEDVKQGAATTDDSTQPKEDTSGAAATGGGGLGSECCDKIVSALNRVIDAIKSSGGAGGGAGGTGGGTAGGGTAGGGTAGGGTAGGGASGSATKIRDLTQEEVDRLSPNMTPNEIAKQQAIANSDVAIAKKKLMEDYGIDESTAGKLAEKAFGEDFGPSGESGSGTSPIESNIRGATEKIGVASGGKYSEQERIANRSRINRIGRMRAGKTTVMDRMQLAGNKMLKMGEISPDMQQKVAAGQSMLSNITDGNIIGGVVGGFSGLMNKASEIGQNGLSGIVGGFGGGSIGMTGVSGSTTGMIPAMGQAVSSAPDISGMIPSVGSVPVNINNENAQPMPKDTKNVAPNIPARVAAQSRTSNLLGAGQDNGYGGGNKAPGGGGGPIQVNTTGTQEIIVRLPDIQALVNQSITSLIYNTVGDTFKNIANKVMSANNFEDVANSFNEGVTDVSTKQVNTQKTIGGK